MPRGQKTCEKCGQVTGPRAFACKNCNTPFTFKAKSREQRNTKIIRDFDWRELKKGDKIKVSGGPYFVSGSDFIPMGYRGKFVVEKVDSKGICAWGVGGRHSGFVHIYMGRDYQNPSTKVWKVKHKILKLKLKTPQNV